MKKRQRSCPPTQHGYQSLEQRCLLAALANGQEVIDQVLVGEAKTYEIEVTTPGQVYVSVGETFNFASDVEVTIRSPDGFFVAGDSGDTGVNIQFDANETGTYTVVVDDTSFGSSFQFRIRTLAVNQQFDLLPEIDGILENGEELSATLPANSLSVYQFTVDSEDSEPQTVFLGGVLYDPLTGQELNASIDTYRPDGSLLSEFGFLSGRVLEVAQSEFGVYTVVVQGVSEQSISEVLDFRLRSLVFNQPFEEIPGRDAFLLNGQEASVDVGPFPASLVQFDLEAGVLSFLNVASEGQQAGWALYDPDGRDVAGGTGSGGVVDFVPDITGRYTLLITPRRFQPSPSFNVDVRVLSVVGEQQHVEGRDQALVNGERATSTVQRGDFNSYTLNVAEPSRVLLLAEGIGRSGVQLEVFSPSGSPLGPGFIGNEERFEFFAEEAGEYKVVFLNSGYNLPTEVAIQAVVFGDNPLTFIDEVPVLENAEVIVTPILEQGFHLFQFAATETERVEFQARASFPNFDLTVFSPTGEPTLVEATLGVSDVSFTAAESGVYTGVIDGRFGTSGNPNVAELLELVLFTSNPEDPLEISFLRNDQPLENPELLARPDQVSSLAFEFSQTLTNVVLGAIEITRLDDPLGPAINPVFFNYDPLTRTGNLDLTRFNLEFEPGYYTIEIPANTLQFSGSSFENELFRQTFYVALPGDANLDGQVNVLEDAFSLVGNLGVTEGATWADGDFNGDGQVTVLDDAFVLVDNLGRSVVTPADVAESFSMASAQPQLATNKTDNESFVTTTGSRDVVFASFDDESDEPFGRQLPDPNSGKLDVELADELVLL